MTRDTPIQRNLPSQEAGQEVTCWGGTSLSWRVTKAGSLSLCASHCSSSSWRCPQSPLALHVSVTRAALGCFLICPPAALAFSRGLAPLLEGPALPTLIPPFPQHIPPPQSRAQPCSHTLSGQAGGSGHAWLLWLCLSSASAFLTG